jgi:hypothetical protein
MICNATNSTANEALHGCLLTEEHHTRIIIHVSLGWINKAATYEKIYYILLMHANMQLLGHVLFIRRIR